MTDKQRRAFVRNYNRENAKATKTVTICAGIRTNRQSCRSLVWGGGHYCAHHQRQAVSDAPSLLGLKILQLLRAQPCTTVRLKERLRKAMAVRTSAAQIGFVLNVAMSFGMVSYHTASVPQINGRGTKTVTIWKIDSAISRLPVQESLYLLR